jgi:glycerophosphoryl diester phosphodiesterase
MFTLFAHRGASLQAPENTIPAFELAFKTGCHWIECDVMMSSDEELFIIHDDTLDRTTTGSGLVYNTSSKILDQLDAGSWFGPSFQGTPIPRLCDLFELLSRYHTHVNLELKATIDETINVKTAHLLAQTLPILKKKSPFSQIVVSSFSHGALLEFSNLSPETDVALLVDTNEIINPRVTLETLNNTIQQFKKLVGININDVNLEDHSKPLSEECVKRWKDLHPRVCVYTINNAERARWLLTQHVQGIFTDDATLIAQFPPLAKTHPG